MRLSVRYSGRKEGNLCALPKQQKRTKIRVLFGKLGAVLELSTL